MLREKKSWGYEVGKNTHSSSGMKLYTDRNLACTSSAVRIVHELDADKEVAAVLKIELAHTQSGCPSA